MSLLLKFFLIVFFSLNISFASVFIECENNFSDYKNLSLSKKVWEYSSSPQILIMQKSGSCDKELEYAWQGSLSPKIFWKILGDESKGGVWIEINFSKSIPQDLKIHLNKTDTTKSQVWILLENQKIIKVANLKNRQGGQYLNLSKLDIKISRGPLRVDSKKIKDFFNTCKGVVAKEGDEKVQTCGLEVETRALKTEKGIFKRNLGDEIDFRKNLIAQCIELRKATQDKVNIRREIKQILELSLKNNFQDYIYRLMIPVEGISWQMWEFLNFTKFDIDVNEFCKDEAFFKFFEITHSKGIIELGLEVGKPSLRFQEL
jgi:hypothetical protein